MNVPAYHEAVKWGFQMGLLSVQRSLVDLCNTAKPKPGSERNHKQVKVEQQSKTVSMNSSGD
jgi:hypothetical protein